MAEAMTATTQILDHGPSLCLAVLSEITQVLRDLPQPAGPNMAYKRVRKDIGRHIEALKIWLDDIRTLPSGLRPIESRSLVRLLSTTFKRIVAFVLAAPVILKIPLLSHPDLHKCSIQLLGFSCDHMNAEPGTLQDNVGDDATHDGGLSSDDDDEIESEADIIGLGEYDYLIELGECVKCFTELGPIVRQEMVTHGDSDMPRSQGQQSTVPQPDAKSQVGAHDSRDRTAGKTQLEDYWILRFRELQWHGKLMHARDGANLGFMYRHEDDIRRRSLPVQEESELATWREVNLALWLVRLGGFTPMRSHTGQDVKQRLSTKLRQESIIKPKPTREDEWLFARELGLLPESGVLASIPPPLEHWDKQHPQTTASEELKREVSEPYTSRPLPQREKEPQASRDDYSDSNIFPTSPRAPKFSFLNYPERTATTDPPPGQRAYSSRSERQSRHETSELGDENSRPSRSGRSRSRSRSRSRRDRSLERSRSRDRSRSRRPSVLSSGRKPGRVPRRPSMMPTAAPRLVTVRSAQPSSTRGGTGAAELTSGSILGTLGDGEILGGVGGWQSGKRRREQRGEDQGDSRRARR